MLANSIVRLNASAVVNSNDWEEFKMMVSETKSIVEREEAAQVLTHECYYDPETFNCLIVEAYADENAFLKHLELIKPLSEKYSVDWKLTRLELLGAFSENVVEAMRATENIEFFYFGQMLQK